jgi:hypothetical protein
MTEVLERGSSFVRDLGEAARENPVSAALIGMGVLWLFGGSAVAMARSTVDRMPNGERMPNVSGRLSEAPSAAMDRGSKFGANVTSATERLKTNASAALEGASRFGREQADTVAQYARTMPDSGAEMVKSFRSSLTDLFKAQPLALGAIGLAIGAGIAAAVPSTKMEAEYLGEASDTFKEKAKQFADEQTTRGAEAADKAFTAAAEEAQRQGLTVDGAKSAASEVSTKMSRVADAAGRGISERMNPNSQ